MKLNSRGVGDSANVTESEKGIVLPHIADEENVKVNGVPLLAAPPDGMVEKEAIQLLIVTSGDELVSTP